ncbi:putative secreted protein (Por secretion system target) [Aquimarina sp. MAR_2010_214]|uniref:reprolysin-like metallopeptidase n=1 Tax=Aquimarina sp. MAR_2010_214 TaxID=1250026 RepID=UPI000C70C2C8|nr:zinc-dependent metalloprotease family protein [Aquimarina sp. MAR_2010_214]PKV51016.1 putative secreted protein (Por secretion system target) [Aquimarina sp. MAR_2010_214]
MKTRLFLFVSLFIVGHVFAQGNNPWQRTSSAKSLTIIKTKADLPSNTLFDLNIEVLKKALQNSQLRGKSSNGSTVIMQFPNEQGNMESYSIVEAPVMHPDLAAKYPEIKSYAGQGIDDPTATIRFSIAPSGLQSMRLSGNSKAVFIEPYTTSGSVYTIYSRDQRTGTIDRLNCSVDENTPDFSNKSGINQKNADDGVLRTFKLAVSTTGEYTQFHGGTKAGAMAAINATMTRVNGIYETDFGVTMVLIANNDAVVYTNANTDPYTGSYNSQLQSTLTSVIGEANYDIGHVFVLATKNGNAGCIGCVCKNGQKGSGFSSRNTPQGDIYDVDYVAHEMGHQFGGNHTFTFTSDASSSIQVEPGSGTTIMGYAGITDRPNTPPDQQTDVQQNSDPYFHAVTIQQITNYVKSTTCQTNTNTGNAIPTANAGADYTVPKGTAFVLTGQGTDANSSDALTYCWEQIDGRVGTFPGPTVTSGVAFRSYTPTASNQRYFPRLQTIKTGATSWKWEAVPDVTRALNFRLTVRDNKAGGGANNSDNMKVNVTASAGPFVVNVPNTNVSWSAGSTQTVTWNVAGTTGNGINAANVDILLSTDGGDTYPTVIATAVPNDGSHSITVPNSQGTQNRIMVKGSGNIFFDISNANFEITGGTGGDTEAPSTPASLTASNPTQTTIDLSWNASTDNVGVSGYDVYQGSTVIGTATTTTYQATGLSANTSYSFRVKAKDAAGNQSGFSTTATATTTDGGTPINYCASNGNDTSYEYIGKVVLGTINKTSNAGTNGYSNFTAESTNLAKGNSNTITITPTFPRTAAYDEGYSVWIDYNQDGDFTDAGEQVWTKAPSNTTPVSGSFTVPASATDGTTRMRVSMKYDAVPTSCESFSYGEVEDYTVVIGGSGSRNNTSLALTTSSTSSLNNKINDFTIYPNPAHSFIMIHMKNANNSDYKIVNQIGQTIKKGKVSERKIELNNLTSGLYFISVTSGAKTETKKFILN